MRPERSSGKYRHVFECPWHHSAWVPDAAWTLPEAAASSLSTKVLANLRQPLPCGSDSLDLSSISTVEGICWPSQPVVKNPPEWFPVEDPGLIPGPGKSLWRRTIRQPHSSVLAWWILWTEGACWATVHGAKDSDNWVTENACKHREWNTAFLLTSATSVRQFVKMFACIISFPLFNSSIWCALLSPFFQGRNWGSNRLTSSRPHNLVSGGVKTHMLVL